MHKICYEINRSIISHHDKFWTICFEKLILLTEMINLKEHVTCHIKVDSFLHLVEYPASKHIIRHYKPVVAGLISLNKFIEHPQVWRCLKHFWSTFYHWEDSRDVSACAAS